VLMENSASDKRNTGRRLQSVVVSCSVLSAHEPVGRSSDPKLETIREFDTTHLGEAAAEGAAVVHGREAMRKLGIRYRQQLYAFVLSPRVTCRHLLQLPMKHLAFLPGLFAGLIWLNASTPLSRAQSPSSSSPPIPWPELDTNAGGQYHGDGFSVAPTPQGARLHCVFQRLKGQVTGEGLWLTSTVELQTDERFRVGACAVGRSGARIALPPQGTVTATDKLARYVRPGLTEEYTTSVEGVRQDFVVTSRPNGDGALRVELEVTGARAEPHGEGVRLVLAGSGRKIAYGLLCVVDSNGEVLTARLQVMAEGRLEVVVEDATAVYPVRIDPTFSDEHWTSLDVSTGVDSEVNAMAVDAGGALYIGGHFTMAGGTSANYVAKWNGSEWSALGAGLNGPVTALAISGSDLYAGGFFTSAGGNSATNIAHWNGTSWTALGSGVNNQVVALAVSGNDVYVGGYFTMAGGKSANYVAKWNPTTGWSPLGSGVGVSGPNNFVYALAVSGSDLYVGGAFATAGGNAATNIAKWNASGWSALGSGIGGHFPFLEALAVSGTDLYAGGYFTTAGGNAATNIAKWNGSTWSALGSGMGGGAEAGSAFVVALAVSGTNVYVGGSFTNASGVGVKCVAKWNGNTWSALGAGVDGQCYALAMSGGQLYAGGSFRSVGGIDANHLAKWNGSVWSPLKAGGLNSVVHAVAMSSAGDLYVGGAFTKAGNSNANYVAKWNGSDWSSLGAGLNGSVNAIVVSGTDVYVGGDFSRAGGNIATNIAKWDGSVWSELGGGVNNVIYGLAMSGSDLYAAGIFLKAGGVNANRVAKWNGSSWSALGVGFANPARALAFSGTDLYVAGDFLTSGNTTVNRVAKWNGSTWSAVGAGFNSTCYALAVSGTDLFVGGSFSVAGITNASNIAKWDGNAWSALESGVNGTVRALAVSGSDLYVGGDFNLAGGGGASQIAKWDGSAWSPLGSGLNSVIYALTISRADLYVGGNFTTAGGKLSAHVAKANLSAATPVAPVFISIVADPRGTQALLTFTSDPVASFYLLSSTNLTTWQTNSRVNAVGVTNSVSVNITQPHEFFRLQ